jgi:hypothetical protein
VKRWLIVIAALAALSLVAAPLALAGGHSKPQPGKAKAKGKAKFQCQATVVSVDVTKGILTVKVKSGSKTIKAFRGKDGTQVTVDPKAKLIDNTGDESVPLTLDKLAKDAKVHLGGIIDRSSPDGPKFTATKVILQ